MKLYTIKDTLVGRFMSIWQSHNDATAIREIKNAIEKGSMNVRDMQLWCLGEYNDEIGITSTEERMVCNVVDISEE